MKANDSMRINLEMSAKMLASALEDLNDADLLLRPVPGANHIAWQLGQVIAGEYKMVQAIKPGALPPLPEGFAQSYAREMSSSDDGGKFYSKKTYLELLKTQRQATLKVLEGMSEADLNQPGPEFMRQWAPTAGHLMNIVATHAFMHLGQVSVVRRKLGKPVLF